MPKMVAGAEKAVFFGKTSVSGDFRRKRAFWAPDPRFWAPDGFSGVPEGSLEASDLRVWGGSGEGFSRGFEPYFWVPGGSVQDLAGDGKFWRGGKKLSGPGKISGGGVPENVRAGKSVFFCNFRRGQKSRFFAGTVGFWGGLGRITSVFFSSTDPSPQKKKLRS